MMSLIDITGNAIEAVQMDLPQEMTMGMTGLEVFSNALRWLFIIFSIINYAYFSLTLMQTAKRLNVEHAWLAWIPIANLYLMSRMAKMHWWPLLLLATFLLVLLGQFNQFLVFVGFILTIIAALTFGVFFVIWTWKICEARNRPGWWAILPLIGPVIGIIPFLGWLVLFASSIWSWVMWGILAWGKD